jgi:hypothetical protein
LYSALFPVDYHRHEEGFSCAKTVGFAMPMAAEENITCTVKKEVALLFPE